MTSEYESSSVSFNERIRDISNELGIVEPPVIWTQAERLAYLLEMLMGRIVNLSDRIVDLEAAADAKE